MKKIFATAILFACGLLALQAQPNNAGDKLGAGLKLLLAESHPRKGMILRKNSVDFVPVFIRTTVKEAIDSLKQYGAEIHAVTGNIITADIPRDNIQAMAASPFVSRIELPLLLRKTDEKLKDIIHASAVHIGVNPLPQAYKGKDVVIGIIDDGIDFTHPDFYTADGKCRIKYLWNMDNPGNNHPAGFDYGYEYSSDDLEKFAVQIKNHELSKWQIEQQFGYAFHGTSVTGLAAGNNGVAPEADIISVALTATGDTLLRSDRLVNGIAYIAEKAKAVHKKAVVNISLGISDGAPHDGSSMVEEAIDYICAENPNLLVCVSAGNNGNNWKHWGGFPINKDSSFCAFYNSSTASLYFSIPRMYRDSISVSVAEFSGSLGSPNMSGDSVFYQSPFFSVRQLQDSSAPVSVYATDRNGNQQSQLTFTSSPYNPQYDELIIKVNSDLTGSSTVFNPHFYRFIVKGTGTVHAWFPFLNLHPLYLFDQNPLPGDPTFHLSDNDYTTTIPSNAFTVLSVGAFNIRSCYVNLKNQLISQYAVCRPAYFTSHGPTLDGRIKPDLIAPGDNVMAPRSRFSDYYDYDFIIDTNTVAFSGTSASSPVVAGAAALLWQKFPLLPRDSIMALLKNNTQKDVYTEQDTPTPNNLSGWGKLDVFKAMTGIELPAYDCDKNDTCQVDPPVLPPGTTGGDSSRFLIFPNPARQWASLQYSTRKDFWVEITDVNGRKLVPTKLVHSGQNTIALPILLLPSGVYFTHIMFNDKTRPVTLKLVVMH